MRRWPALLLVCLAGWAWPAAASAATAVILPVVGGDAAVSEGARERARTIGADVLRGEGWRVFDADEVTDCLPEALQRCAPGDACAFELRAILNADAAVGLSLFGEGDDVRRVEIVITGSRGVAHRTEATVDPEAGLPFAVAEPLRAALAAWTSGRVTGPAPQAPASVVETGTPAIQIGHSPLNYFLGALFVLGSAPMLGYGINSAVRDGECINETAGGCVQRIRFKEGAGLFTGLGAATFLAGALFLILRPIPLLVSATPQSAWLEVRGTF